MKTCYVGVGGVGCRALKVLSQRCKDRQDIRFLYYDTDKRSNDLFDASDCRYIFEDYPYGTGCFRALGRDMFRKAVYTDEIPSFVDDFFRTDEVQLRLVTTSFGGFGSAVVFELADYLSARIMKNSGRETKVTVRVIAFTQEVFRDRFPKQLMRVHEVNTLEFINEYFGRSAACSQFFPDVEMFAVYGEDVTVEDFPNIVTLPVSVLKHMDVKNQYRITQTAGRDERRDVFISFSSRNQDMADKLVAALQSQGISTWISSQNMKPGPYPAQIVRAIRNARVFALIVSEDSLRSPDVSSEIDIAFHRLAEGMVMMPFLIDDAQLDENNEYYLKRHQWFDGKKPPLEEQLQIYVEHVKSILEA